MLYFKLYSSQDECCVNAVAMAEAGCWYQRGVRVPAALLLPNSLFVKPQPLVTLGRQQNLSQVPQGSKEAQGKQLLLSQRNS